MLTTLALLTSSALASDVALPWQARLMDSTGAVLSGDHTVEVSLYKGSTPVWQKDLGSLTFENGYVSVVLSGTDDLANTPLDSSLFANDLMIGVAIDGGGELTRTSLLAVPRAASVRGTVVVSDLQTPCSGAVEGAVRYADGAFEGCTSRGWVSLSTAADGSTADLAATSCKEIHALDGTLPSDVYWIRPNGTDALQAYCDMTTAGGGWTLLLTLTHPQNQYSGSVSPFATDLNASSPSPSTAYSRDWRNVIEPAVGSEFMVMRNDGPWVRFVQSSPFCGWANATPCHGGSSNVHYLHTVGQAFGTDGAVQGGVLYFSTCARIGGCSSSGSDAPGFSGNADYPLGSSVTYGAGWNGSGIAYFYWGTAQLANDSAAVPMTYWYR